ncbi:MAG: response regulator transcription factor [Elusimicrobia bacterium]|nr:response regulator transcription factor [Elusimicrobiota bacterium]
MHQRTLLLIDDDRVWSGVIARCLQELGYKVIFADTCAAGVKAAREACPDCVLLDFNLPDMDGCKAAFAIRKDVKVRKTPIIMASNDESKEFEAYQHCQVDGFYFKMWPLERLKGQLELLLLRVDMERGNLSRGDIRLDGVRLRVIKDSQPIAELSADQFKMFSLIMTKAPEFVTEADITSYVFDEDPATDKTDAIKMLAYRLRKNLGAVVGERIKCARGRGWAYQGPEDSAE